MIDLTKSSDISSLGDDIEIITDNPSKPNPLTLMLTIDKQGNMKLNLQEMGNISDPQPLIKKLREVFENRNTAKIEEKAVTISVSTKFDKDILTKAIKSLKDAGAKPIIIFPKDK